MSTPISKPPNKVRIWDLLVRGAHWSIVVTFVISYFTQEQDYGLHLSAGYTLMGVVAVRVAWGFVGPRHARFAGFVRGPVPTLQYLGALARGNARRYLGHNPAGGAMTVVLLLVLFALATSGVALDAAENRAGPLAGYQLFLHRDLIFDLHHWGTDLAIILIALHLIGIAISSIVHRENLVVAMITGNKWIREPPVDPEPTVNQPKER